jgi:hypothetical protein
MDELIEKPEHGGQLSASVGHAVMRLPMGLVGDLRVTSEGPVQEIVWIR